jgi:NADP-dependent 3-hydroxy acid dehydrogenase YdfG
MQTILITGGSSGIGEALALAYAGPDTELGLLGRNAARLDNIAARCRERGAKVSTAAIDVRARAELKAWIGAFDSIRSILSLPTLASWQARRRAATLSAPTPRLR